MAEIVFLVTGLRIDSQEEVTRSVLHPEPDGASGEGREGHVTTVRVGGFRAGEETHEITARTGHDIVVLHIAGGGPELILHPETARELFEAQARHMDRSGTKSGVVNVQSALAWPLLTEGEDPRVDRGGLREVLVSFFSVVRDRAQGFVKQHFGQGPWESVAEWFGDDAREKLARWAGGKIGELVDAQVQEGVYELTADTPFPLGAHGEEGRIPAGSKPNLVFIHGTFVNSQSTFGDLFSAFPGLVTKLRERFALYALDHSTMGKSPIHNALTLARACSDGAHLQLLTHSRGGLVAEVLVRARALAGDESGASSYVDSEGELGAAQVELRELIRIVHQKGIIIDKVVRVACPAHGTLLASKRLDVYLSVLRWALKLAAVPGDPLLSFLQDVAATRADPTVLPGLEAMQPDSALLRWLNEGQATGTQLRVIAGDVSGDSVLGWVKTLIGDFFFWADNDLIVHTRSMYGGVRRSQGDALFRLFSSGKSTHFGYFKNIDTVTAVFDALWTERPTEFQAIGEFSWAGTDDSGVRGAKLASVDPAAHPEKPVVFVLPGILGSHLRVDDERVWMNRWRLLGVLDRLAYPSQVAEPDGVLDDAYGDLIRYLDKSHHVVPFGYDWRLPIDEEARRLGKDVKLALDARATTNQPVRFLAHSMGGLVVRTFMLECASLWESVLAHPAARFLMLGTPNAGSYVPMQVFSGDDDFGNLLAFTSSPFASRRSREVMANMPGFVQLQADLTRREELGTVEGWQALARSDEAIVPSLWHKLSARLHLSGWGCPPRITLENAKILRQRLDAQIVDGRFVFAERTLLVVGRGEDTPEGFQFTEGKGVVYIVVNEGGDGTVTHASACLPGVSTWQVDQKHGKLGQALSAFDAYKELLETGTTNEKELVSFGWAQRGAGERALTRRYIRPARRLLAPEAPQSFADLFGAPTKAFSSPSQGVRLRVTVRAGDVRFVSEPLLMGHYSSLTLTGAEGVVNRLLGGSMQKYLDTTAYPTNPGESTTFRNPSSADPYRLPRPHGAIVVGLGNESTLRQAELQSAVCNGVLNWVKTMVHSAESSPTELTLASTLVGSGGVGISAATSARAVALGVQMANRRLSAVGWPRVTRLILIEVYKDRAIEAHRSVSLLTEIEGHRIQVDPEVDVTRQAKSELMAGTYRGAEYDLVSVEGPESSALFRSGREEDEAGPFWTLRYAVSTRRSRTEVASQAVRRALIRQLIQKSSNGAKGDPQTGRTLFRALVPPSMVDLFDQSKRLVLELDESVAPIPWEIFQADDEAAQPWAISCQLVRKLRLTEYRSRPTDTGLQDAVLIVGEPDCGPAYRRLPGALAEARAVAQVLSDELTGPSRVLNTERADATTIVKHLYTGCYRIIHIAGHGEAGASKGVVLSDGAFLGATEIGNVRDVPELVFVNCCHLGTVVPQGEEGWIDPGRPAFAASVATALIRIGVRCVVAAGWAVDDAAARCFAERFYACLLKGFPFSHAVAEARRAARHASPHTMTWAAYQCYGDPDWTFRRDARSDELARLKKVLEETVSSEDELVARLGDLAIDLNQSPGSGATLKQQEYQRLEQLEQRYGDRYGGSGRVAEAFAQAFKVAGARDRALDWFDKAQASDDGLVSLAALEQCANLRVNREWDRVKSEQRLSSEAMVRALGIVDDAIKEIQRLLAIQTTVERLCLVASAYKRRAMIRQKCGESLREDLLESTRNYLEACAISSELGYFYPALNVLSNRSLLGEREDPELRLDATDLEELIVRTERSIQLKMQQDPDFFGAVGHFERLLYVGLAAHTLSAQEIQTIVNALEEDVRRRVSSPHPWRSLRDNLAFVVTPYLPEHPARHELEVLLSKLDEWAT